MKNFFTKKYNKLKNSLSTPLFTTTLLMLAVIVFLFNFNPDALRVVAATQVVGQGVPGYLAMWVSSSTIPIGTPTGTLLPAPSSCVITSGNSCNVVLNWTLANPQSTPTSITASDMIDVAVSNTLTTPQSGAQFLTVPYTTSPRTFYLYNDGILLAQSTATATIDCSPGTSWDGSNCSACVNGAINPPTCTICSNGATNPPTCTTNGGGCLNGATNSPTCTINSGGSCINGATNPPTCTTNNGGRCVNGGTNPPTCTNFSSANGACGSGAGFANGQTYPYGTLTYGTDAQCSVGTPTPSGIFPTAGNPTSWQCAGLNGGTSASCSASQASSRGGSGYCGSSPGSCTYGNPSNEAEGISSWTWNCANTLCTQLKKKPVYIEK